MDNLREKLDEYATIQGWDKSKLIGWSEAADFGNWLLQQGWVNVNKQLPKPLQTVWIANGKGWVSLGCLIEDANGSHWAESNGTIYCENGEIVSECESEDLDVVMWHQLPTLNNVKL